MMTSEGKKEQHLQGCSTLARTEGELPGDVQVVSRR